MENLKSSISTYLQFYSYDAFSDLSLTNAEKVMQGFHQQMHLDEEAVNI
jgi:hypothetical protein